MFICRVRFYMFPFYAKLCKIPHNTKKLYTIYMDTICRGYDMIACL